MHSWLFLRLARSLLCSSKFVIEECDTDLAAAQNLISSASFSITNSDVHSVQAFRAVQRIKGGVVEPLELDRIPEIGSEYTIGAFQAILIACNSWVFFEEVD